MKILFVCKNNVARSQIAKAIFNNMNKKHTASAAGTHVLNPGESLKDRALRKGGALALEVMQDNGYDIGSYIQTQLSKADLEKFDLIINMSAKKYTPRWLAESPKYLYWDIRDPKDIGYEVTDEVRQQIESRVKALSEKIISGNLI